jgi:hypothetical protein
MQNLPVSTQNGQDAAKGGGHVFVLSLLGPFQKILRFFFGDRVCVMGETIAGTGAALPLPACF